MVYPIAGIVMNIYRKKETQLNTKQSIDVHELQTG